MRPQPRRAGPRISFRMRWVVLAAGAALGAGVALVADAVLHGRAALSLVVIVPVVSGSSAEFFLGVVLLVTGVFLLPLSLWELGEEEPAPPSELPPPPASSGAGGLVLVGPVPIFFGSWRNVSRRTRWLVALVGALLLGLLVVGLVLTWG